MSKCDVNIGWAGVVGVRGMSAFHVSPNARAVTWGTAKNRADEINATLDNYVERRQHKRQPKALADDNDRGMIRTRIHHGSPESATTSV